jgi:nitroreductase
MQDAIRLMRQRISVRTYDTRPVEKEKIDALDGFLREQTDNPFRAQTRFSLFSLENTSKTPGTYGSIHGAQHYMAGCVKRDFTSACSMHIEGFGFAFEKAVLFATSLGLGTCWLGAFQRAALRSALRPDGELIPAASPVGYAANKKTLAERMVAAGAGARSRKPWNELFFEDDFLTPMDAQGDGQTCLEMVRIGPSASNRQPWRIVRSGDELHFYMAEERMYAGNLLFGFCMQRLDMGIAACHFSLAAQELSLPGRFSVRPPRLKPPENWRYIVSWI